LDRQQLRPHGELYRWNGATASVSLFRKEINGFFVRKTTEATSETLARIGLSDEYLAMINLCCKMAAGQCRRRRVQLPSVPRRIFSGGAGPRCFRQHGIDGREGPSANDFTNFSPKTASGGIGYARGKIASTCVSTMLAGGARVFLRKAPQSGQQLRLFCAATKVDGSASYMLNKHYTIISMSETCSTKLNFVACGLQTRRVIRG